MVPTLPGHLLARHWGTEMIRCPRCGGENHTGVACCGHCGAALFAPASSPTAANAAGVMYATTQAAYRPVWPYASARALTIATVVLLSICGAMSVIEGIGELLITTELLAGSYSSEEMSIGDGVSMGGACVGLLATLGCAVVFLIWLHRVSRNLRSLGVRMQRFSPGWAVGYWFIPIVNIVRPYQVVKEIWVESRPPRGPETSAAGPPSALVGWWWATWLVAGGLSNISARLSLFPNATDDMLLVSSVMGVVAAALTIVDAILAIKVVRGIYIGQEARIRWLETAPEAVRLVGQA